MNLIDGKGFGKAVALLMLYIVLFLAASALVGYLMDTYLPSIGLGQAPEYSPYVGILVALAFGYLIVVGFSNTVYWSVRSRYDHPAAAAVKNVFKIIGIGAMVAAVAGGVVGGAAGVALGGFIGLVIGFASQQVLGQALAGLFLLIAKPFRINDAVNIAGEDSVVCDISIIYTTVTKSDGVKVLIPSNMVIGSKIYVKPK